MNYTRREFAFSLIELLIVISVISALMAILLPSLTASRAQARHAVCKSNLRQILLVVQSYTQSCNGSYPLGAEGLFSANLKRWYGQRDNTAMPFDNTRGPLSDFLSGEFPACPEPVGYKLLETNHGSYEFGNGGYGYNLIYIGSIIHKAGYEDISSRTSAKVDRVSRPAETLLFADTAFIAEGKLIRYAFADPRYYVVDGEVQTDSWDITPSLHFRHRKHVSAGFADGHIDKKRIAHTDTTAHEGSNPRKFDLGWFKPVDNSLFDLK